ncbi:MAG: YdeI/OmpD-associated family protein [Chthoniobacterales bacterium]
MAKSETPTFFATPKDFRAWLRAHHADHTELWVGFYRRASGRQSITWPESVDEALCVGWIDGLRKGIDELSYKIRFTPRRAGSTWSAVNLARVAGLTREKRMRAAGLKVFAERIEAKSGIYAYEQREAATFPPAFVKLFRTRGQAWDFFQAQPAGYRKTMTWWVIKAQRPETRAKRLERLIAESEAGRRMR